MSSVARWSSLVARWAHNPKVAGSNPALATTKFKNKNNNHRIGKVANAAPVGGVLLTSLETPIWEILQAHT